MITDALSLWVGRFPRPIVVATAGCIAAAGLFVAETVRAIRLDPLPRPLAARPSPALAPPPVGAAISKEDLVAALERDPFRSDRRRAALRYQLPGRALPAAPPAALPPNMPMVRLAGIAATGSTRGIAALSILGRPPQLLRVGESLEGWRLTHVRRESVVLTGRDTTITLQMPQRNP